MQGLSVAFPIRSGLLQRAAAPSRRSSDVSFEVARGRTLALVGESGCGKTTTGKAIVQLLRGQARIDGQALLEGRNLFELQGEALLAARRDVQIIFQDPFASLNPRMRVSEILEEGLPALQPAMSAGAPPAHRPPGRAAWGCAARPAALSARVLGRPAPAHRDRPRAGGAAPADRLRRADLGARRQRAGADPEPAAQLQRELGLGYLFITHNIGVVEYVADDVAVMRAGAHRRAGRWRRAGRRPPHVHARRCWRRCRGWRQPAEGGVGRGRQRCHWRNTAGLSARASRHSACLRPRFSEHCR